jgi:hypothetical protein
MAQNHVAAATHRPMHEQCVRHAIDADLMATQRRPPSGALPPAAFALLEAELARVQREEQRAARRAGRPASAMALARCMEARLQTLRGGTPTLPTVFGEASLGPATCPTAPITPVATRTSQVSHRSSSPCSAVESLPAGRDPTPSGGSNRSAGTANPSTASHAVSSTSRKAPPIRPEPPRGALAKSSRRAVVDAGKEMHDQERRLQTLETSLQRERSQRVELRVQLNRVLRLATLVAREAPSV